jgi:rhodanese-related sulfurtransferase
MPITKGFRTLVDEATAQITTYTVAQVQARLAAGDARLQLVDIRDPRELEREGTAPGCVHAPRGMLEFWVDPASPYFKPVFGDERKEFVLFCGAGWRSALATKALQDMGLTNVAHIDGAEPISQTHRPLIGCCQPRRTVAGVRNACLQSAFQMTICFAVFSFGFLPAHVNGMHRHLDRPYRHPLCYGLCCRDGQWSCVDHGRCARPRQA